MRNYNSIWLLRSAAILCGGLLLSLTVGNVRAAEGRGADVVVFQPLADEAPRGNAGLFVGVNQFTDATLQALHFSVHDAVELAHLFVNELRVLPACQCYLLLSGQPSAESVQQHLESLRRQGAIIKNATRAEILEAFLQVCDHGEKPSDLLIVSFSSHGFEQGGSPYLMPSDGRRRLLAETAVPLLTLEQRMAQSRAGHRLLLVDACQERVSARSLGDAGTPMARAFFEALQKPTGQAKLASCSPGEKSYEDGLLGGVGHGVFTSAILEGLRGKAPADAQNMVRFGAVTDYVVQHVTQWSRTKGLQQTPWLNAAGPTRDLPLALRADDTVSLTAAVRRLAPTAGFDASLRDRLADRLSRADSAQDTDRLLMARTRDFVRGTLSEDLFLPYVRGVIVEPATGPPMRPMPPKPPGAPPEPAAGHPPVVGGDLLNLAGTSPGDHPPGWTGADYVSVGNWAGVPALRCNAQGDFPHSLTRRSLRLAGDFFVQIELAGEDVRYARLGVTLLGEDVTSPLRASIDRGYQNSWEIQIGDSIGKRQAGFPLNPNFPLATTFRLERRGHVYTLTCLASGSEPASWRGDGDDVFDEIQLEFGGRDVGVLRLEAGSLSAAPAAAEGPFKPRSWQFDRARGQQLDWTFHSGAGDQLRGVSPNLDVLGDFAVELVLAGSGGHADPESGRLQILLKGADGSPDLPIFLSAHRRVAEVMLPGCEGVKERYQTPTVEFRIVRKGELVTLFVNNRPVASSRSTAVQGLGQLCVDCYTVQGWQIRSVRVEAPPK